MGMVAVIIILLLFFGIGSYGVAASRKSFRRVLPGELELWVREELLSKAQAEKLRQRYQLPNLARESQATLINTIFIFGAILIACGVVAFVTANWNLISKLGRLGLVTGLMIVAHGSGFYLWKVKGNSPRLGHALVLLGSFIFAADIGLVIQIFHLRADLYSGFLFWGIGALAIAYATLSVPHMVLAALASVAWLVGWYGNNGQGPLLFLPLFLVACLPFAFRQHSRGVHFVTLLIAGLAVITFFMPELYYTDNSAKWVVLVGVILGTTYWNYGTWPPLQKIQDFSNDSKIIGVLVLGTISYILSFNQVTFDLTEITWTALRWGSLAMLGLVIFGAGFLITAGFIKNRTNKIVATANRVIMLIAVMLMAIISFANPVAGILGTFLANCAVVFLGSLLLWLGLSELDRRYFWLGMILLALEIVGRFFEYETGLLLKSLIFVGAGVAVMIGGVKFEKRYRKQRA